MTGRESGDARERASAIHAYVMDALVARDESTLRDLMATLDGFPHGVDPWLDRHWITNAIDSGEQGAVQWVLDQGVALDFCDGEGFTPIHAAIERGGTHRLQIIEVLIAAGASVNRKGVNDWTPAHMAAAYDDVDALRLLVRSGADLAIRTAIDNYATPLEVARSLRKTAAGDYLASLGEVPPSSPGRDKT